MTRFTGVVASVILFAGVAAAQDRPRSQPRDVPPARDWTDPSVSIVPGPQGTEYSPITFRDRLNTTGQLVIPYVPSAPVTNSTSTVYENTWAMGPAQSYFFHYEAPYQVGTDFHGVRVGEVQFGK